MNTLSVNEAIELIKTSTPSPVADLSEIRELCGEDFFAVWFSGYLMVKHPNGGQIQSRFYVDLFHKNDQWGLTISDVYDFQVEGLKVIDEHGTDQTDRLSDLDEFELVSGKLCPVDYPKERKGRGGSQNDEQRTQDIENVLLSEVTKNLGGVLTIEAIVQHNGFQKATEGKQ